MKREDPQRYQMFMDLEDFTKSYIKQKQLVTRWHGGPHITIPVVVHILHNGEPVGTVPKRSHQWALALNPLIVNG